MTDQEMIIAIAELDGWTYDSLHQTLSRIENGARVWYEGDYNQFKYLTSRDAIIPVIEKHMTLPRWDDVEFLLSLECTHEVKGVVWTSSMNRNILKVLTATPKQLSIALLKVTGRYKD